MASSNFLVCLKSLCVIITLFLCPLSSYAQYLFIFGDSLYDPGNNIFITPNEHIPAYYPPYGMTFFNKSTGRFSDGRTVADFIAVQLNLPFLPPALDNTSDFSHGANFASAGGGVLDTNPDALCFGAQVDKFSDVAADWKAKLGEEEATRRLNSAVYLISIGGDDYFAFLDEKGENCTVEEQDNFVDVVMTNFTPVVERIYDLGGRKFMFQSVAPMGCLPMWKQTYNITGDGCAGKPLRQAKSHNDVLATTLHELQTKLIGFRYSIFDYYHEMGDRIINPAKYGFKVGDVACCGSGANRASDCGSEASGFELCFDPTEYIWFDGGHNTDQVNSQLGDLMWNGGSESVAPFNMKQLFELEPTATTSKISSRKSGGFAYQK